MVMELANQRAKLEAVSCEWGLYEGVRARVYLLMKNSFK